MSDPNVNLEEELVDYGNIGVNDPNDDDNDEEDEDDDVGETGGQDQDQDAGVALMQRRNIRCKQQPRKALLKLAVPCLAWIVSANPKMTPANIAQQVSTTQMTPIIIYWSEPLPPKFVKRKLYFGFLGEWKMPLRGNVAQAISRENARGINGFRVGQSNTFKYVYPVPPFENLSRGPGNENNFVGVDMYRYEEISFIPSYLAPLTDLLQQTTQEDAEIIDDIFDPIRGTESEQMWYRNKVVSTCSPTDLGDNNYDNNGANICRTSSALIDLKPGPESKVFSNLTRALGWDLRVFLQYVYENTLRNFANVGQGKAFEAFEDLFTSLEQLMIRPVNQMGVSDYGFKWTINGDLVYPDDYPDPYFRNKIVVGLRKPMIAWPSQLNQ